MPHRTLQVVKTIDLPSGTILEVVKPETGEPYTRVKPTTAADRDLCVC
jgi:hypothetical protein